jgi:hypothetical protein
MSPINPLVVLLLAMAVPALGHADAIQAVYDFEDVAPETGTPFSVTNNGITATFTTEPFFTSSGTPFFLPFFVAGPVEPGSKLQGSHLRDNDFARQSLDITFSQALSELTMDFRLRAQDNMSSLTLNAYVGGVSGTPTGGSSALGTVAPQISPWAEGTLSFDGFFDAVRLTSNAPDFAVDSIQVTSAVPEATSLLLLGVGLGMLGLWRRRSRKFDPKAMGYGRLP